MKKWIRWIMLLLVCVGILKTPVTASAAEEEIDWELVKDIDVQVGQDVDGYSNCIVQEYGWLEEYPGEIYLLDAEGNILYTEYFDIKEMFPDFDISTVGKKTYQMEYHGFTKEFEVNIRPVTVEIEYLNWKSDKQIWEWEPYALIPLGGSIKDKDSRDFWIDPELKWGHGGGRGFDYDVIVGASVEDLIDTSRAGVYEVPITVKDKFCLATGVLKAIVLFSDVSQQAYYYDPVLWAVKNGITKGQTKTDFSPKEDCTRAQAVTFLWRAAGSPEPESTEDPFIDVSAVTHKNFYKAILWAKENHITDGYRNGTFRPEATVTRAEFVTFLYRYNEVDNAEVSDNPFVDVNNTFHSNFINAIMWAYENDITTGKDAKHFQPDKNCSRANVVTFLYRNEKIKS